MEKTIIQTPLGKIEAITSKCGLVSLEFDGHSEIKTGSNEVLIKTKSWLDNYFSKNFKALPQIPIDLIGTDFFKKVWGDLINIKLGEVTTYGKLGERIGYSKAARAIGTAVGKNPISLIIPCHRVIGKNNTLTGFAGGLERKEWLLRHEGFFDFVLN